MVRLHVLSDLHIDHEDFQPPDTDADAVILAGDIGVGVRGLAWILARFDGTRPIVYVPGNHEFYFHDLSLAEDLVAAAPSHVHALTNRQVVLGDVRVLGATLWTDFLLFGDAERRSSMEEAGRRMNDFETIRMDGRAFAPEDSIALHQASRTWLAERVAEPFDGTTVVVTHHLPSARSVPERFAASRLSAAFASDLESLMNGRHVALWVHGHTHVARDYRLNGTRVICNPRGYPRERAWTGFQPDLVVDV